MPDEDKPGGPTPTRRVKQFKLNLSPTEKYQLEILAGEDGVTCSQVIRALIRRAFKQRPQ